MSNPGDHRREHVAAGQLAGAVAPELSRPLRALRDRLAVLVETLDEYVMTATGPKPYPWNDLKALREDIAAAYLESRRVTRLAGDLADAVGSGATAVRTIEVTKVVESAMNLAKSGIRAHVEVFIDEGGVPPVSCAPGSLILAVAQLIMVAARSAARIEGGAISIRTRADGGRVYIIVADNGTASPAAGAFAAVADLAADMGGAFEVATEPGAGAAAELSLPAAT